MGGGACLSFSFCSAHEESCIFSASTPLLHAAQSCHGEDKTAVRQATIILFLSLSCLWSKRYFKGFSFEMDSATRFFTKMCFASVYEHCVFLL
jgi:hypothetical protein